MGGDGDGDDKCGRARRPARPAADDAAHLGTRHAHIAGRAFEFYDLFLTAYIALGLVKAGYFTPESLGLFSVLAPYGVAGVGTFVFAVFAGLFVGAIFSATLPTATDGGRSSPFH